MYRFEIKAYTQMGESIALLGSTPELGAWNLKNCIPLCTSPERYPLWWTDPAIDLVASRLCSGRGMERVEYKYVRLRTKANPVWEPIALNRWLPLDPDYQLLNMVIEDGEFGYPQPYPFGYPEILEQHAKSLKIVVIGSSVALNHRAWLLRGWTWLLGHALAQQGHQLINLSTVGANVSSTIERFMAMVEPHQPDIVILALSLGNEGLASCLPHERRAVQRRFESGLQQLIKMTRTLGAHPILAGVYPHNDYGPEHGWLLRDTHQRMLSWGVPVLDWLAAVENGQGQWQMGLSFDAAHPNSLGHRRMYQAIDLGIFTSEVNGTKLSSLPTNETLIYGDAEGFRIAANLEEQYLRISNSSKHHYKIAPYWQELQAALQRHRGLRPGIYIATHPQLETPPFLAIQEDGAIETILEIPPQTKLEFATAFNFFAPNHSQLLFYDGNLGLLKEGTQHLRVINESNHEYSIQPMWKEIRSVLKALPSGIYRDPLRLDAPFSTLMIGRYGLESRVKVAPRSQALLEYQGPIEDIKRIGIIPLGDRCAMRMLLYKMEYDGPAFPFDLTRTTKISDVADMIENKFFDMWNPDLLHYNPLSGRIHHIRWVGLSFAHEIETTDTPLKDMTSIYERIRSRYTARAGRFWHTLRHADQILFVRTGLAEQGGVLDLVHKLKEQCLGKPFKLLLLSPQDSEEFVGLPQVIHYNLELNPDRMYEDLGYWMHCTEVMREILQSLGISSNNLFWCPPNPPLEN